MWGPRCCSAKGSVHRSSARWPISMAVFCLIMFDRGKLCCDVCVYMFTMHMCVYMCVCVGGGC